MQSIPLAYNSMAEIATSNSADSQAWSQLTGGRYRSATVTGDAPTIFVIDNDATLRETIRDLLEDHGYAVECFADGPTFLRAYQEGRDGCLLIDALIPGMSGIALLGQLKNCGIALPAIVMSRAPPLHVAVQAMKAGAVDFIEKPFKSALLLATVKTALQQAEAIVSRRIYRKDAARRVGRLTKRQHEILDLVVAGHPTKNIAADLHIRHRVVDNHRAAIARKTNSKSLPALIQTTVCANCSIDDQGLPQPAHAFLDNRTREGSALH